MRRLSLIKKHLSRLRHRLAVWLQEPPDFFCTVWLYHLYKQRSSSLYHCISYAYSIFSALLLLHSFNRLTRFDYLSARVYEVQTDVDHDFLHPYLLLQSFAFSVCYDVKILFITFIFLISFRTSHDWQQDYSERWRQTYLEKSTRCKLLSPQITRE